jgi:uncharacterized membrane protein
VAHAVGREDGMRVRPALGLGDERRDRARELGQLRAREDRDHALDGARGPRVDARDVGVRVRAAHDREVEEAGETEIVEIAAAAGDEAPVLLALERLADERVGHRAGAEVLRCSSRRRARSSST